MDDSENPYEVLGVPETATATEIKTAYRKLALRHHPDRQVTEEEKQQAHVVFAKISNAYELLSDESTRKQYDREQQQASYAQPSSSYQQQPGYNNGYSNGSPFGTASPLHGDIFDHFHRHQHQHHHFAFHDPFEIFTQVFGEEFGTRRRRGGGGVGVGRDNGSFYPDDYDPFIPQQQQQQQPLYDDGYGDPFLQPQWNNNTNSTRGMMHQDPFFGGAPGFGGAGGAGMFGNDIFSSMNHQMSMMHQMMQQQQQQFPSQQQQFPSQQQPQQQQQQINGRGGAGGPVYYSSSSSSTSSFGGPQLGGGGGGHVTSVSTTTRIINGKRQTVTERIVTKPDGTLERQVETSGDDDFPQLQGISSSSRRSSRHSNTQQQQQPQLEPEPEHPRPQLEDEQDQAKRSRFSWKRKS